jgi:hypothetical protein
VLVSDQSKEDNTSALQIQKTYRRKSTAQQRMVEFQKALEKLLRTRRPRHRRLPGTMEPVVILRRSPVTVVDKSDIRPVTVGSKSQLMTKPSDAAGSHAKPLMNGKLRVKVYTQVKYRSKNYRVLVDNGGNVSILSKRVLPDLQYQPGEHTLFAANMSRVPVLGKAMVTFEIAGYPIESEFLVSEVIEELIFESDWLEQNRCVWDSTQRCS